MEPYCAFRLGDLIVRNSETSKGTINPSKSDVQKDCFISCDYLLQFFIFSNTTNGLLNKKVREQQKL